MRYETVNNLDQFEFHDAAIETLEWDGGDIILILRSLNVTTRNSQNPHPTDMCIPLAYLTFRSARIGDITFWGIETKDWDGQRFSTPPRTAAPEEYGEIFRRLLSSCRRVLNGLEKFTKTAEGYSASFGVNGQDVFSLTLTFAEVLIQWDAFTGPAWYAKPPAAAR